jgi:hypothetical protein
MTELHDTAAIVAQARRLLALSRDQGWELRVLGGVAVALTCPSAHTAPLRRSYGDIDLVARASDRATILASFEAAGLTPDAGFNALNGFDRLWFWEPTQGYKVEVFLDRLSMCHTLELADRLELHEATVPPADLLLMKLQVVEATEKDLKDAVALLCDFPIGADGIDADHVSDLCSSDWGWWRTATATLDTIEQFAGTVDGTDGIAEVPGRIAALRKAIDERPKSRRWKLRARVGDRVRWHEVPEEVSS